MNHTKPQALLVLSLLAIGCAADDTPIPVASTAAEVEQTTPGTRPPPTLVESFDGLGFGFQGPHGPATGRNPSDNSLAVGPNHIVQTVNSRLSVFSKRGELFDTTGDVLYGAVPTNTVFKGFGGTCEARNNGDAVVRYDQLADRWPYEPVTASQPASASENPTSNSVTLTSSAGCIAFVGVYAGNDRHGEFEGTNLACTAAITNFVVPPHDSIITVWPLRAGDADGPAQSGRYKFRVGFNVGVLPLLEREFVVR